MFCIKSSLRFDEFTNLYYSLPTYAGTKQARPGLWRPFNTESIFLDPIWEVQFLRLPAPIRLLHKDTVPLRNPFKEMYHHEPTETDSLAHESSNFKNTMETVSGIFASLFPLWEIKKKRRREIYESFCFFATTKAYPSQQHLTLHLTKCKEKVVMFAQFNAVLRVNRFLRLFTLWQFYLYTWVDTLKSTLQINQKTMPSIACPV